MSRVLLRDGNTPGLRLRALDDLGVPSLQALQVLGLKDGESRRLQADGEEWLGRSLPRRRCAGRGCRF